MVAALWESLERVSALCHEQSVDSISCVRRIRGYRDRIFFMAVVEGYLFVEDMDQRAPAPEKRTGCLVFERRCQYGLGILGD